MLVLSSDVLAPWGQAAALILAIYIFVNILVGLALTAAFLFLFAWLRGKVELIKKVRPAVNTLNMAMDHPESAHPTGKVEERVVQAVEKVQAIDVQHRLVDVQHQVEATGEKIDQGVERVANVMIEIRARTAMVKGMTKAFFLPGLMKRPAVPLLPAWATPQDSNGMVRIEEGTDEAKQLVSSGNEARR